MLFFYNNNLAKSALATASVTSRKNPCSKYVMVLMVKLICEEMRCM